MSPLACRLFRTPPRAAFLALAFALGLCGCESLMPEEDTSEDEAAKKEHYETAAQTYYEGGKYDAATMQWRKVLALTPDDQKAKWGIAKSLAKTGRPAELRQADHTFEEILAPGVDWVHPVRGDIRFEVEKDHADVQMDLAEHHDKNIRALEAMLQDPNEDRANRNQQRAQQVQWRTERLQKVIPLYGSVLAKSPGNPYAVAGLARAHLLAGNEAQGLAYARQYIEISQTSQRQWGEKLEAYAKEVGGQSQVTDEQREFFRSRIRGAREKELKMHLLVATVLMRQKRGEEAAKEYDRVLELDPAQPAAYVERAQAFAMAGQHARAVRDLEEYLKLTDPVKQREARASAAELLEQYRQVAYGRPKAPTPATSPAPTGPVVPGPR